MANNKEQVEQKTLDASVIIDSIECLHQLINSEPNKLALYNLGNIMAPYVKNGLTIYLTGIGKPGYVAMKQAASMKSIMVDGQFIDATLAGHGDLGSISTEVPSLLIAFSKSGRSTELYKLFDAIKQLRPQCSTVMLCMSTNEQLEELQHIKNIDAIIRFEVEPKELDGYGIVPATSNLLFEAIMAQALHNACMANFDMREMCHRLQRSHPSGTLYNKVTNLLAVLDKQVHAEQPAEEPVGEGRPSIDDAMHTAKKALAWHEQRMKEHATKLAEADMQHVQACVTTLNEVINGGNVDNIISAANGLEQAWQTAMANLPAHEPQVEHEVPVPDFDASQGTPVPDAE